jgi:hypothetical protein
MFCVVYNQNDPADASFACGRLLHRLGISTEAAAESIAETRAEPFTGYVAEYGVPGYVFISKGPTLQPIAGPTGRLDLVSAFAVAAGEGLIYIVPGNIVSGSEGPFILALTEAIQAHAATVLKPETAPIVESFVFTEEVKVRQARHEKLGELESLNASISDFEARKEILFLRGNQLADAVPEWISTHFGIPAARQEEHIEDFWLLNDEREKLAICEVKALDKNVTLVLHRDQRELRDTYPSLLVVNTFAEAKTEVEKSKQRVGPLECKKAVRDHVLVIRTLDLVRLLDQLDRRIVSEATIRKLLTSATGWLKVEGDTRRVVKD